MGFESTEALLKLAEQPGDALEQALNNHGSFERAFYELLPTLQARPALVARLRAGLDDFHRQQLELWLPRRRLGASPRSPAAFAALVTHRARERDPGFPDLPGDQLVLTNRGYCASGAFLKGEADGRGWWIDIDSRDTGPAEVIHEEEWQAEVWGPGFRLKVYFFTSGPQYDLLYEEPLPPAQAGRG